MLTLRRRYCSVLQFFSDEAEISPPYFMGAPRTFMLRALEGLRQCCNESRIVLQFHFVLNQSNCRLNLIVVIPAVGLFSLMFIPHYFCTTVGIPAGSSSNRHFTKWSNSRSFSLSSSLRTYADVSLICI